MAMSGFICHDDYYDRLKRLTDEEVGHLFRQLMLRHAGREDEMTDFIGGEGIAFDFIVSDIERMEEKCETNSRNGAKGGRPKNQPTETEENQTKANETELNRNKPTETESKRTKAYKDKEKDKDKDIIKENPINGVKENRRFFPPTPEEVAAYCRERGNTVNADRFCDFYSSKGWRVGNQPMKDWKAAVRTWEKTENKPPAVRNIIPAQDYHQRDYTDAQEAAFERMMEMGGIA